MLEDKDKKLPDATENQPTDKKKSVKKIAKDTVLKETKEQSLETDRIKQETKSSIEDIKVEKQAQEEKIVVEKGTDKELDLSEDQKDTLEEVKTDKNQKASTSNEEEQKNDELDDSENEAQKTKESRSQKAIDEVEKQVAKQSENLDKVPEVPMEDYQNLDLASVVTVINELIENHPIQAIKKHIDVLKKIFNKKFGELLKEAKTKFLEEGGNTIDFHYENPIQEQYNKSLFVYKKRLKKYYKELEKQYEENLLLKNNVIEELKHLIDNGEASSMYKQFKQIQEKWRNIGPVSRDHYSDLWRTYHFHVERFYDLLHLRNDLRDLDFKHNLEEKLKLIVKAEALAAHENIKYAFDELQILHRLWKEEIGPVSREKREEIWERFSAATKKIHDKRHEYFDGLKEKFRENLIKKEAVIEKIDSYDTSGNKTHKDWQKSIKDIGVLREQFFAIGRVPQSKNKYIWNRFKEVTKKFNKAKNTYYKGVKQEQLDNLKRKMELVERAESLRDSKDWDIVTDVMKNIQSEWKKIGHVPRKHSDKIWNRFKEACNYYFDRLHAVQDEVNEEKFAVYAAKKNYLEDLTNRIENEKFVPDLKQLKSFIKEWNELGVVPKKQSYINAKFNKLLDVCFKNLSLDKKESTMIRYRNMINNYVEQKEYRKLENEIQFVRKKTDEINKEKQQLENNMLFFSNTDESNPMIKNILKTIDKHKQELEIWEEKLRFLRTLEI